MHALSQCATDLQLLCAATRRVPAASSATSEQATWAKAENAPRNGQPSTGGPAGPSNGHVGASSDSTNERDPRRLLFHRCANMLGCTHKQGLALHLPRSAAVGTAARSQTEHAVALCRRLRQAAADGQPEEAAVVVEDMRQAGLPPGARAYNSLIYANAKAGRPQEALEGLRAAYAEGAALRGSR